MSKIVILTASTGAGHNQAAQNLKVEFESRGSKVHIVDMFKLTHKSIDVIVSDGYKLLATKLPKAYGIMYKTSDIKYFNPLFAKHFFIATEMRLKKVFKAYQPDLVISTHPFGAPIMGGLKKRGKVSMPFIQIVTDFKAHYTYVHAYVDAYIAASDFTKQSLIHRGIPAHRIFVYGIPTKPQFKVTKQRVFSEDRPFELLVMGGSMGLKPMAKSVERLVKAPDKIKLTVVCGTNASLRRSLEAKCSEAIASGHLKLLGFVDNIHELMEEADVIISKPGGLTTTEAINKCIPMIIPFAIPGQEQENTAFLVENEMALEVQDVDALHWHIRSLIDNPEAYQRMVANMEALSKQYSMQQIIELSMSLIQGQNPHVFETSAGSGTEL